MFFTNDNDDESTDGKRRVIPLLPLRDIIVFPHMVVPLYVGREKSINALEDAMSSDKELLLAAQKKAKTNDPKENDIFRVGTVGSIIQLLRLPDDTVKVLVEGKSRARIIDYRQNTPHFATLIEEIEEPEEGNVELEALMRSVQTVFENYVKLNKRIPHRDARLCANNRQSRTPDRYHRRPRLSQVAGQTRDPRNSFGGKTPRETLPADAVGDRDSASRKEESALASKSRWRSPKRNTT